MATPREEMVGDLQGEGLGEQTQEAYVRAVRKLSEYYRMAPDQLNERQVRESFKQPASPQLNAQNSKSAIDDFRKLSPPAIPDLPHISWCGD